MAQPIHRERLTSPSETAEIMRKQIARESNIPQIPERIMVKGENNQKERTHLAADGLLADTYENSR
jgi:hypothetical protein